MVDPVRAAEGDFSPPYMQCDFTFLVPAGSSIRNVADADQPGVRIAVPRGDTSDLRLSKILNRAELVRTDSIADAMNLLRTGHGDAYAGPRPVALAESAQLPGSRVLEDAQYSPRTESMIALGTYAEDIRWVALQQEVPVFDRFSIMKLWVDLGTFDLYSATKKLDIAERIHTA